MTSLAETGFTVNTYTGAVDSPVRWQTTAISPSSPLTTVPLKGGVGADGLGYALEVLREIFPGKFQHCIRQQRVGLARLQLCVQRLLCRSNDVCELSAIPVSVVRKGGGFIYNMQPLKLGLLSVWKLASLIKVPQTDAAHHVVVHATNAQLPDSFSEAEIQSMLPILPSPVQQTLA